MTNIGEFENVQNEIWEKKKIWINYINICQHVGINASKILWMYSCLSWADGEIMVLK